jgi:hypothetical protein
MGVLTDRRGSGLGLGGDSQHPQGREVEDHPTATLASKDAAGRSRRETSPMIRDCIPLSTTGKRTSNSII